MKPEDSYSNQVPTETKEIRQKRAAFRNRLAQIPISTTKEDISPVFEQDQYPQYTCSVPIAEILTSEEHINSVRFTQGAYGSVSRCELRSVEGFFAVKTVKIGSPSLLKMTVHEFETLSKISHPGIVSVYRLILEVDTAKAFIVMELVPGRSLAEIICEGHRFSGKLYPECEVQSIARQFFSTLAYLEGLGLVHRDINPANVLLTDGQIKLIDFQTAASCKNDRVKGVVGTAPFQAPEMWESSGYDSKADVWSAGAVLARLVQTSDFQLSPSGQSFLSLCSKSLPVLRLSAAQALSHTWLL